MFALPDNINNNITFLSLRNAHLIVVVAWVKMQMQIFVHYENQ